MPRHPECSGRVDAEPAEIERALLALRGLELSKLGTIDRLIAEDMLARPEQVRCKSCVRIIDALVASISLRER